MIQRTQHPSFGTELRALICSPTKEHHEIAGIIVSEMEELARLKERGSPHPKEFQLHGDNLSEIHYLQVYRSSHSIRIYFIMFGRTLWMLGLDPSKRRNLVTDGMKTRLIERLRDIKTKAKKPTTASCVGRGKK